MLTSANVSTGGSNSLAKAVFVEKAPKSDPSPQEEMNAIIKTSLAEALEALEENRRYDSRFKAAPVLRTINDKLREVLAGNVTFQSGRMVKALIKIEIRDIQEALDNRGLEGQESALDNIKNYGSLSSARLAQSFATGCSPATSHSPAIGF